MGKINFEHLGSIACSSNTAYEHDREATEEGVLKALNRFAEAASLSSEHKECFIFGMGAQPKSLYSELEQLSGIKVLWYRTVLPKKLAFFRFIVASYEGLIRIEDARMIPRIFTALMSSSMVGLYCVDPQYVDSFVSAVCRNETPRSYDFGVKQDKGYLLYIVDADNSESSTGIFEILSYGVESAKDFIPI